jgi:peptidoglycan/xylan/chitin deacetylase (PgdA/CDA1 family)
MTLRLLDSLFPQWVWRLAAGKRQIALTFDDGPDPTTTPALLDVLKELNVKATFFLIGEQVAGNAALLGRAAEEGHVLANHGYCHASHAGYPRQKLRDSIEGTERAIADSGIRPARLFRPPYGFFLPGISRELKRLGYRGIMWTSHLRDWRSQTRKVLEARAHRSLLDGSIILLHDTHEFQSTLLTAILPSLVEDARRRDFQFVTLTEEVFT